MSIKHGGWQKRGGYACGEVCIQPCVTGTIDRTSVGYCSKQELRRYAWHANVQRRRVASSCAALTCGAVPDADVALQAGADHHSVVLAVRERVDRLAVVPDGVRHLLRLDVVQLRGIQKRAVSLSADVVVCCRLTVACWHW